MFGTICAQIGSDADYDERVRRLDILQRVLDGRLYDVLPYRFHEERGPGGEYIPLRDRQPSVRYPLVRIVVDDSISLLFGDGHFPTVDSPDASVRAALVDIAQESSLNAVMLEAARTGSVGSVAVLVPRACAAASFFSRVGHRNFWRRNGIRRNRTGCCG